MSLKKICVTLLMTVMVSTASASCNYGCSSGFSCFDFCGSDPFDGWVVYGDWLYWNVRRSSLDFAVPFDATDETVTGKVYEVCPDYENGWRLGFRKDCGRWDFGMRYTTFCTDHSNTVKSSTGNLAKTRLSNVFAITTNGNMSYAQGLYKVDLREVDVEFGCVTWSNYCLETRLFTGFKYAFIDQDFDVLYGDQGTLDKQNDFLKYDLKLNAYGFYSGGEATLALSRCFTLFGNASYGAFWGNIRNKIEYLKTQTSTAEPPVTTTTTQIGLRERCERYINNVNLTIGLEYYLTTCCFVDWTLAVGYEFHHWFCMPDFIDLESNGTVNNPNFALDRNSNALGFDGMFVRLKASF